MIGAAETLPVPGRVQPIFLEGKLLPLPAPTAADLNLHDGQVVQAMVRSAGGQLTLLLQGKMIDVPASQAGQLVADKSIWLRVQERADGPWGLMPLAQPTASPGQTNFVSRIANLLYRPPGDELSQLLNGNKIAELLQGLARPDLQTQWRGLQLSMAQLSPEALRNALLGAMGHEAWLSRGRLNPGNDPKQFLRSLLSALEDQGSEDSSVHSVIRHAIDSLESSQVQAVQAQVQREVMFSLTLPFMDSNPVTLVFRRPQQGEGQPPVFTVNVHSKSDSLGPVWLQTQLTGVEQVDLVMWAQLGSVAEQARTRQADLVAELEAAGLNLNSFQVIHGQRPSPGREWTPSGRGLVVDISA